MRRPSLVAAGAVNAAIAVGCGAFAAHGLRDKLEPRMLEVFETGARYQMYHAIAMVLAGILATRSSPVHGAGAAGWLFQLGIFLFSGSLYALALSERTWLGAFTPFGGVAFLVGWAWLAYSARRA